jgi:4-hydroxyphenylacetate 3-monooxygenase
MIRTGDMYLTAANTYPITNVTYEGLKCNGEFPAPLRAQMDNVAKVYYDQIHANPRLHCASDGTTQSISAAYAQPISRELLVRKSEFYRAVARGYSGVPGRMPDYMSAGISAWAAGADAFGEHASNVRQMYRRVIEGDLYATHSTSVLRSRTSTGIDTKIQVLKETADGIVISGVRAMATSAPISDIIFIFPNRLVDASLPREKAIFFSVPSRAQNLHFYCRSQFSGLSGFVAKHEETDALISFDQVFVPWSDVYIYKDLDRFLTFNKTTGATHHFSIQTNARAVEKLSFLLSVVSAAGDLMGHGGNEHFRMLCGQVLRDRCAMEAMQLQAIESGHLNEYGVYCPRPMAVGAAKVYFMEAYPRIVKAFREHFGYEFFQLFESRSMPHELVSLLAEQWGMQLQDVMKRAEIVEVMHDMFLSNMATRSELYEMYFAGNPRAGHSYFWDSFKAEALASFQSGDT